MSGYVRSREDLSGSPAHGRGPLVGDQAWPEATAALLLLAGQAEHSPGPGAEPEGRRVIID